MGVGGLRQLLEIFKVINLYFVSKHLIKTNFYYAIAEVEIKKFHKNFSMTQYLLKDFGSTLVIYKICIYPPSLQIVSICQHLKVEDAAPLCLLMNITKILKVFCDAKSDVVMFSIKQLTISS